MRKLLLLLLFSAVSTSYGAFTVNLDAGQLKGPGGMTTLQSDNTFPSNNGSLLLLIAAGGDSTFSNSLSPGQYVSGNDVLLAAGGFNMNFGTNETQTSFTNITAGTTGDLIALRWFPNITFAQFKAGATPTIGQSFGTYNPLAAGNGSNNPDGGDPWAVPAPGSTIALDFLTISTGVMGATQPNAEGFANFSITSVPEPSTYASAALAALGAVFVRREFKNKQDSMVQT